MSERKLWCEDNSMVQSRVVRFIGSFKKYGELIKHSNFNYGRETSRRHYELKLEGLGDVTMQVSSTLVRRDSKTEEMIMDIGGISFVFPGEGDRFCFIIPIEWIEPYVHNDVVGPFFSLESLGNEVLSFLEDYL